MVAPKAQGYGVRSVDQGAIAIDRAIQIPPTTTHPNVCVVDVPASADFAFS
jgi:hypothetical protein